MIDNGMMRAKKPQLSDSIQRLDEMVNQLSAAIPAAVGEAVREVMGGAVAAAIRDAVADGVRQALAGLPAPAPQQTPAVQEPRSVRSGVWTRVKSILSNLKRWLGVPVTPVLARLAVGWAVMKLIGGATLRSRSAALATTAAGTTAGFVGLVAGPVVSAVLFGLAAAVITSAAMWAAPLGTLFVALRDEGPV
jgi:hypothetical protein